MANWVTTNMSCKMTVSLWRTLLVLLAVRQSIVAVENCILGTYCKGAVGKKGDQILAGSCWLVGCT